MLTVCVAHAEIAKALRGLAPSDVEVVEWDAREGQTPPEAARDARLLVPSYMGPPWTRAELAALPRLEAVQLLSAGYDGWPPALPPGVTLCSGQEIHGASTAEVAVLGVLAWRRRLMHYRDEQAAQRWSPRPRTGDLDGLRVTVLGAGDIAGYVRAALTVFGADVTLVGRTARDGVVAIDDLPRLLPTTQALVLALPLTETTAGLVDADVLGALPDGAVLVNVARGGLVDTEALVSELQAGRLHAFLDVTDPEPLPAGHPLWSAPGCVVLPHIGGGTDGWVSRAARLVGAQAARLATGEELRHVVDAKG